MSVFGDTIVRHVRPALRRSSSPDSERNLLAVIVRDLNVLDQREVAALRPSDFADDLHAVLFAVSPMFRRDGITWSEIAEPPVCEVACDALRPGESDRVAERLRELLAREAEPREVGLYVLPVMFSRSVRLLASAQYYLSGLGQFQDDAPIIARELLLQVSELQDRIRQAFGLSS